VTKDPELDSQKSTIQREEANKLFERMQSGGPPVKALLMVDDDYGVVDSFSHDDTQAKAMITILKEASEVSHGVHAMISFTLTGGR
jgi:hypothetical protein